MAKEELRIEYQKRLPYFERAKKNIIGAIEYFLKENNISFFSVTGRVKGYESFIEKIERKNYSNPFTDNEDFCGVRIIVYYQDDIERVEEIIYREFDIINSVNKTEQLAINELGYRSNHFVVHIKKDWLSAPNYRQLENIKIELQVRTILMHTWAEIEHKLAYKHSEQIPKEVRRLIMLLSGNFEIADRSLQQIKGDIEDYRDEIKLSVTSHGTIPETIDLNYDSLVALLDHYLEGFPRNRSNTITILERAKRNGHTIEEVQNLLQKISEHASYLNNAVFPNKSLHLAQATILAYAMDAFYGLDPSVMYTEARKKIVNELIKKFTPD